jgi:hypothetical protein
VKYKDRKFEGHWRVSVDEVSELPWPTPNPDWGERGAFLHALESVEGRAERIAYRGISICRICRCHNGHEGLRLGGWEWPAGYRHYIADHGVRPSLAFEDFILNHAAGKSGANYEA